MLAEVEKMEKRQGEKDRKRKMEGEKWKIRCGRLLEDRSIGRLLVSR